MTEERVGTVVHYWPRAHAAEIRLEDAVLRVGDRVRIRGHGRDVVETVESLEIDHRKVTVGHPGEPLALAVREPVHRNDEVLLLRDTGGPKE